MDVYKYCCVKIIGKLVIYQNNEIGVKIMTDNIFDEIPKGANIASYLPLMAQKYPYKKAVIFTHGRDHQNRVSYTHYTFAQLEKESNRLAHGIMATGLKPGERTIVLVPPSLEFVVLAFALMKTGIVPVMIDPGMGINRMVSCIAEVEPVGFFGCPKAHIARVLFPKYFRNVRVNVTVGKRYAWGGTTLDEIVKDKEDSFKMFEPEEGKPSAIFFTTGPAIPPPDAIFLLEGSLNTTKQVYFGLSKGNIPQNET